MVTRGGIRTSSSSHSRWRAQMPRPEGRHFDCKFPPYDCVPSHDEWTGFSRNLLSHGGRCNENGDSIAHA